ncbi:Crp/Fnr family transcriptional regulator [Bacillus sp. LL01]|uniref:Crp/Fnr family transcriptional regulator n=1 Tax=Bacillus sp. LL01 TaxID=1665556 RepID=UPI00064D54E1|nr:Crp/Fnr family transcriptional regulator [Bacillus sp. LL01]KMJ58873.1 Crp/Fnr family transcriptional regulator [Bacillus sp. LL01]
MSPMTEKLSKELKEFLFTSFEKKLAVKKGAFLFQEGMVASEIYLVLSGSFKISKVTPDGQELTLRLCSKDDLIGELTLFCAGAIYMLSAKAMDDRAEVLVIYKHELEKKLAANGQLAMEFMKWMSLHLRKTQTKFRDLVLNGRKGALYSTLIRMSNSYGVLKEDGILINLPLTNQELANYCGTSREVVNRMLSELKRNRTISVDRGKITIHDLNYLKLEIHCENCPDELCRID